jgi:hypothetical protein
MGGVGRSSPRFVSHSSREIQLLLSEERGDGEARPFDEISERFVSILETVFGPCLSVNIREFTPFAH